MVIRMCCDGRTKLLYSTARKMKIHSLRNVIDLRMHVEVPTCSMDFRLMKSWYIFVCDGTIYIPVYESSDNINQT